MVLLIPLNVTTEEKRKKALATLLSVELQKMRSNHTLELIAATKARYLLVPKRRKLAKQPTKAALKNELRRQVEIQQRRIEGDVNRGMWTSIVHVWSPRGVVRETVERSGFTFTIQWYRPRKRTSAYRDPATNAKIPDCRGR